MPAVHGSDGKVKWTERFFGHLLVDANVDGWMWKREEEEWGRNHYRLGIYWYGGADVPVELP